MRWFRVSTLKILAHIGALLPLIALLWDFSQGQLTADPIREIQLRTGKAALLLLVITLGCTPAYLISGFEQARLFRRLFGLYTMMYASLHFLNFIGLDYGFDFALIREDIFEKRYAVAGFAAFLVLLALAVTSTIGWKRRLGKKWRPFHRFIYVAALLAVLHFLLQVKAGIRGPLIYGAIVVGLLAFRTPMIREALCKPRYWVWRRRHPAI